MSQRDLGTYRSRAARALVLMHDREMRSFVGVWRRALATGVTLPETDDEDYRSMEALLRHVLRASRFYVTWMSKNLDRPGPEIRAVPDSLTEESVVDEFLEHLLERWRAALETVSSEALEGKEWPAPWGANFTIDSMLEHAVLHPMRHGFQLAELAGS